MRAEIDDLIARIRSLEGELENRLAERRRAFGYRMRQGRIVISRRVRKRQQALKIGLHRYLLASGVMAVLTAPFIYIVVLPIAALDAFASLYQSICFRVYGLARVRRRDYVVFDRHKLPYLNVIQKLNCLYCAYANGVLAYVAEIASRTEQYWCPIKHAARVTGTHRRYDGFLEYGDVADYPEGLEGQRQKLKQELEAGKAKTPPEGGA
ncbi:MAG: hypothetical protein CMF76_06250 [Maricaulis sp.]|uniref:Uncharacterized protein n=1 Tax=Maricaulis virginensis TaxID=144022 RepID=A0A9W6IQB5_9PROT|nr:hypothetical protein [Maricaulis virginensis]MAZ91551.1 hypothetical protein [Maricaulis sp.]GLK53151.1 hypothetical protein GCM10017621_26590 [Maricaulis virginensis]